MSNFKTLSFLNRLFLVLFSMGILFSCSENDNNDSDGIGGGFPSDNGNVTITSFDISDAEYLMVYTASKARSRADDDLIIDGSDWGTEPVVVKVLSDGTAMPVMYATQGDDEIEQWIPKSISRIHTNYMVFETENIQHFAPFYLVRMTDGKVYEFGYFNISETYLELDEYLYVWGYMNDTDYKNPIDGMMRIYLPSNGTPTIEQLGAYDYNIDIFTKDYFGSVEAGLITGYSSNRSYNLPSTNPYRGQNYNSNTFYYREFEVLENGFSQILLKEYGITNHVIDELSSISLVIEWYSETESGYPEPMPKKSIEPALALGIENEIYIVDGEDNHIWSYSKSIERLTDTGHSLDIVSHSLPNQISLLNENKYRLVDDNNNIHIIDLNQNNIQSMFYTLFDASKYNNKYRINKVEYNKASDKYYFYATRLADTKQILLSMDATLNQELIEEQVYDATISYLIPIN